MKLFYKSTIVVSTFAGDPVIGINHLGDRYYTVSALGRGRWLIEDGNACWETSTSELQRFFKPHKCAGLDPIYQPDGEEVPVYEEVRVYKA